jgi:hypothetical protein
MDPFILLLAAPLAVGIYLIASSRHDARWRAAQNLTGFFLVAVPLGALAHLFSGIWIARARGVGHFFSVPIGGYTVSDSAMFWSLACWVGLVFTLMVVAFRGRLKQQG